MANVLVIDDSKTMINIVKTILKEDGHEVQSLNFIFDVSERLKTNPPDLIILDLQMPAFSGEWLGKFIREKLLCDIPIIFYSSLSIEEIENVASSISNASSISKKHLVPSLNKLITRMLNK